MSHLPRVLFLCTGNTARSQMAEAILRQRAGDHFEVHSAGLDPSGVRPETLAVLEEAAIPTDGLYSKGVEEFLGKMLVNHLITVCSDAEERCPRVWPVGGLREHWSITDPAAVAGAEEERLEAFRRARDEIARRIEEWLAGRDEPTAA